MTDRLPHFDASNATPEQKAVLDEILSGPRGNLNGPFLGWIHSPELAQHAQRLGAFCRYRTGLPLRLSELAILVTAARWQAQAEWHIHYPIALEAGVALADAEAIRLGQQPSTLLPASYMTRNACPMRPIRPLWSALGMRSPSIWSACSAITRSSP